MTGQYPTTSPPPVAHGGPSSVTPAATGEKRATRGIRRRNRIITSCLECRRRKLKCNKQQPCDNCTRFSTSCVFIAQSLDPQAQAKLAEVKEKMGMLEQTLEQDLSRRDDSTQSSKSPTTSYEAPLLPGQDVDHSDDEEEDLRGLGPSRFGIQDITYHEDDDDNDDIVDLGVAIGKLRITERIGGLVRPKFSEELAGHLKNLTEDDDSNPFAHQSPSVYMNPGSEFAAPSSSFFFAPGVEKTSLMTYLPSKNLVDKLMANYWKAVHLISHTVHRPTFERHYDAFWRHVASGIEPRMSFQAVLFAALLGSIISMSKEMVATEFGVEKQQLVDNFQQGTEAALAKANFLRTTKLETLQAFVMYLIPLCRAEVSRAHSALTGTCIRLAECMGLHRDPASYTTNPIEIQTRRLLWFQLGFLDIRTCEATGPHPQIRRDEYDTQFPLNVDDSRLQEAVERGEQVTEDSTYFTDMTITRMRFECYEMHRVMWTERPKMQRPVEKGEKKTTLTSLLSRIQAFKAAMEKKYLPMMGKTNPEHAVAIEMYTISSTRLYVNILHPFATSSRDRMPARLRDMLISSCIMIVEHSMSIEQQPALKQWAWYIGALHQYHVALLFLTEMSDMHKENYTAADTTRLDRIWRCVDYCFELPSELNRSLKIRLILKELTERTGAYATLRRMRAPTDLKAPDMPEQPGDGRRPSQNLRTVGSESRAQSRSTRSESAGFTQDAKPPQYVPQQQTSPPPPQQQNYRPSLPPMGPSGLRAPLGSMPQVDWGTIDLSPSPQPPALPQNAAPTYEYGGFVPTQPVASDPNLLGMNHPGASGDRNASPMANGPDGRSGEPANPMVAAMNDIDWNEWEQLFGGSQMGAGDLLIPPFTFPSFEPSDLQWSNQGGRM